ncbi:Uncharacterised protein [Salmonella enterica subsp. arizonae]|nr:Uncharacterised protein [Salmonella enterica subsp. arizonae]
MTIDKQALRTDLLIVNALETAKQLRELQESPVAEAIFESIIENENGKEIQFERPISDSAYAAFLKIERLVEALEAAEKRIAELEASHSKLRDTIATIHNTIRMDGGYTPLAAILNAAKRAYEESASAAGIGVKQQEDSVDSDVSSRNQPGMVVAVHIDAGDFVKVKGQVFEVEETDFDDHDVTLWFVGGNALKCAAGCPVEVVSAPVAAGIKVKGE